MGKQYTITFPDGTAARPDLCETHAEPLLELRKYAPSKTRRVVVDEEDVEARRVKPATKKTPPPRKR